MHLFETLKPTCVNQL